MVFLLRLDYNCQIMSFEARKEARIERQVDAIFEDVSHMSVRKRMVTAAFDLLPFINEERLAQDEIQDGWLEQKENVSKPLEKKQSFWGRSILEGFAGLAMGSGGATYAPTPADDYRAGIMRNKLSKPNQPISQDKSSEESTRLQRARFDIEVARGLISEVYNLKPRWVEKAEMKARSSNPNLHIGQK